MISKKINILLYIFTIFLIFCVLIIPEIPTNTYNIDDKLGYFLQGKVIFLNFQEYLQLFEGTQDNCENDFHCINWLSEFTRGNRNYLLLGFINSFLFNFFQTFSDNEIINISKTYFVGFLFIQLIAYGYVIFLFTKYFDFSKKNNINSWYFWTSIVVIFFVYFDGRTLNLIISSTVYYSYIPTVYAPRGPLSVFIIGIIFLFLNKKYYFAISSCLILIGLHAGQAFLINTLFFIFLLINFLKKQINLKPLIYLLIIMTINFFILKNAQFFRFDDSIVEILNFQSILKIIISNVTINFYVILSFIIFKNLIIFKYLYEKKINNVLLIILLFEIFLITFYLIQLYSANLYFDPRLNIVTHSYGQIYFRFFGMIIVPLLVLNFIVAINLFEKYFNKFKLFNIKYIYILFFLIFIFNINVFFNNINKTRMFFDNYSLELNRYLNREVEYIFEENFDKSKKFFLSFDEIKKGNINKILRPDINDPEFILSLYYKASKI